MTLPYDSTGSKNTVQSIGSSTSYGKRYTAAALLNLTARGEDDDGKTGGSVPIDQQQLTALVNLIAAVGGKRSEALTKGLLKYPKIESLDQLPSSRFEDAKAAIEAKRGQVS